MDKSGVQITASLEDFVHIRLLVCVAVGGAAEDFDFVVESFGRGEFRVDVGLNVAAVLTPLSGWGCGRLFLPATHDFHVYNPREGRASN